MSTPAVSAKPRPSSKEQVVSLCERTANTDVCTPQWMANQGELFQEMIDFINFASSYHLGISELLGENQACEHS